MKKIDNKKSGKGSSPAAEERVDHAAAVKRGREEVLWYAKEFNDANEAAKVAYDRYFEAVSALCSAEEKRFEANDVLYMRLRDGGDSNLTETFELGFLQKDVEQNHQRNKVKEKVAEAT